MQDPEMRAGAFNNPQNKEVSPEDKELSPEHKELRDFTCRVLTETQVLSVSDIGTLTSNIMESRVLDALANKRLSEKLSQKQRTQMVEEISAKPLCSSNPRIAERAEKALANLVCQDGLDEEQIFELGESLGKSLFVGNPAATMDFAKD